MVLSLRTVLVVEDNELNREILVSILEDSYNVIAAENGAEALELLMRYGEQISLILLDIVMPVMDGYGFMNAVAADGQYTSIPIIVTTANNAIDDELKSLGMGASDFVTKPYNAEIVKKRVESLIRLKETSILLHKVERDSVTGLYNRDFFFEYAGRKLRTDEAGEYDMLCLEVESYRLINLRYGDERCEELMRHIVDHILPPLRSRAIIGRIEDEQFALLMKHVPYEQHAEFFEGCLSDTGFAAIPDVKINCGVYSELDRSLKIETMCSYALMPIDKVRFKFSQHVAKFDDSVRERIRKQHFLLQNMKSALKENQFKIYYQPKHNVNIDATGGAEALVRWIHPTAGFISPGEFITLFEHNGFISELDKYILEVVCRDIRRWMDEGRKVVPISVNVSQIDFANSELDTVFESIVDKYSVPHSYIHFEITESANAADNAKKKKMVDKFISKGFEIELDDFGAGYSSLSTLGELPINVMKVDMAFIRNMYDPKYFAILEGIMLTAKFLKVKVVTEGVESADQVETLKKMCGGELDLYIQGFYYSKPLPVEQFEEYIEKR